MAIQLNDRDHLIFSLIDEHEVLLEKHISWFIAEDNKPVLIRDRLRKLFYLDYLLCHRHATKLPWWSTPTKPLVYMLSPMARTISSLDSTDDDRFDSEWQRHHLEVANLRMLYLIAQNEGAISDFTWKTSKSKEKEDFCVDAKVSFNAGGISYDVGIVNISEIDEDVASKLEKAVSELGVELLLLVSRDESIQSRSQKAIASMTESSLAKYCFFATHQDLYKEGMVQGLWQNAEGRTLSLFPSGNDNSSSESNDTVISSAASQAQALSA